MLLVVALGSIVLGMGLPSGATCFVIVVALSSGIEAVGIPALTLHLFVVVFAVTPPVALAAFAAAPIAGADPIRTGLLAAKIRLAGFLTPFVFAYHPAMLYKLQIVFAWLGSEVSGSKLYCGLGIGGTKRLFVQERHPLRRSVFHVARKRS